MDHYEDIWIEYPWDESQFFVSPIQKNHFIKEGGLLGVEGKPLGPSSHVAKVVLQVKCLFLTPLHLVV